LAAPRGRVNDTLGSGHCQSRTTSFQSHGWNVNISYASDGSVVEIVVLDAKEAGLYPVEQERAAT
jgi:hypothetical protein